VDVTSLGYTTDLALLALGGSVMEDRGDHLVVRSPHNPTHWWGNFLLLAGMPATEDCPGWLERFHETFPAAAYVALGVDVPDGTAEDLAWFAGRGLSVEAQTVMTATEVHAPRSRNDDAVCRALASDADWDQSVELRVRCIDEGMDPMGYREFAARKAATMRGLAEAGHGAWFGAFLEGRLVSQMGLFCAGDGLARFQSVETDPDFRRQGLAGTLLHVVSRFGFDELAARTQVMVAEPDYFAIELYRAVGFAPTQRQLQVERRPRAS